MELINDPRLFSGGAVKFDSSPTVNFFAKLQAQRQAKADAIDEYVRNLNTKITSTGVRNVDLPALNAMRNDWMKFWVQNKNRIDKDPMARAEFDAMGQQILNFAQESKSKEEAKKPFVGIMTDPNKAKSLRPESFGMVQSHDLPLMIQDENGAWTRNQNRKDIDYNSKLFKDPEFDFGKAAKEWGGEMKPQTFVDLKNPETDKQTGLVFFKAKDIFSPEQQKNYGINAARNVLDDEDKLDYYKNRIANIDKKEYLALNELYKSVFGGDIEDRPERLAAAEAVNYAKNYVSGEKLIPKADYERRNQDAINKIYIQNRLIQDRQNSRDAEDDANEFDRLPSSLGFNNVGGVVYDNSGTQTYSGDIPIRGSDIPEQTRAMLKSGGVEILSVAPYKLKVTNGVVMAIADESGKRIVASRSDMANGQKKWGKRGVQVGTDRGDVKTGNKSSGGGSKQNAPTMKGTSGQTVTTPRLN